MDAVPTGHAFNGNGSNDNTSNSTRSNSHNNNNMNNNNNNNTNDINSHISSTTTNNTNNHNRNAQHGTHTKSNIWPFELSRIFAAVCCTLGLFNLSRFSIFSILFGGKWDGIHLFVISLKLEHYHS